MLYGSESCRITPSIAAPSNQLCARLHRLNSIERLVNTVTRLDHVTNMCRNELVQTGQPLHFVLLTTSILPHLPICKLLSTSQTTIFQLSISFTSFR